MAESEKEFLTYKGFPLVKNGNVIYYGNFYDDFIIEMTVAATKQSGDTEVPSKIVIKLLSTDETLSPWQRMVTAPAERKSLSEAMSLAYTWLSRKVTPAQ